MATDSLTALGPETPRLLWINSPSNPTGRVLPKEHLQKVVDWCRERGSAPRLRRVLHRVQLGGCLRTRVLHPDVCGDSHDGILAVHSLSKRSNLAGYRCAFVAGDRSVVAELLAVRKNLGLQMPGPQQRVLAAVLADDRHSEEQHERYAARRATLRTALETRGLHHRALRGVALPLGHARAGRARLLGDRRRARRAGNPGRPGRLLRALPAPSHVRVAFTATDERVGAAAARLAALA